MTIDDIWPWLVKLPPCWLVSTNALSRDVSPAVVSVSESCDHFQVTQGSHEPVSTKQNSRHSFR